MNAFRFDKFGRASYGGGPFPKVKLRQVAVHVGPYMLSRASLAALRWRELAPWQWCHRQIYTQSLPNRICEWTRKPDNSAQKFWFLIFGESSHSQASSAMQFVVVPGTVRLLGCKHAGLVRNKKNHRQEGGEVWWCGKVRMIQFERTIITWAEFVKRILSEGSVITTSLPT